MLGQEGGEAGGGPLGSLVGVVLLLVALFVYFLPSLIAAKRQVPNAGSVFVLNLFLGWSLIGWVIALSMAVRTVPADGSVATPQRPKSAQNVTYTHSGSRYLFGTTFNPASYAIWDRENVSAPLQVFPYTEHGKTEGFARFESMEPRYEELPPQGKNEQPTT